METIKAIQELTRENLRGSPAWLLVAARIWLYALLPVMLVVMGLGVVVARLGLLIKGVKK